MVRNYKEKRQITYTLEVLQNAVDDVTAKRLTYRQAFEKYKVPTSVIFHRIKGRKVEKGRMGAGRHTALSLESENEIVGCLIARSKMGYPCDKAEVKRLVSEYVTINNINTPFRDGQPGEDWYHSFMNRHQQLSLKKPELLQKLRQQARKPEIIYDFYNKLQNIVQTFELDVPDRDVFTFNADESGFNTDPSRVRAIGEKGKVLCRISEGSGRESITVLACVSADGTVLPPLIVFKGAAVQARWVSAKAYPGTLYTASTNGWMEEPQFFSWFNEGFIPFVKELRVIHNLPNQAALLLYDGHSSHISARIVQKAMENNIQLLHFPSHLTDRLQPLDKCVFGRVKRKWDKVLVEYGKTQMGKSTGRLPKEKFAELLNTVWSEAMSVPNIKSGFYSCGIRPVDATQFPEDFFDPVELREYKTKLHQSSTQIASNTSLENTNSSVSYTCPEDTNIPMSSAEKPESSKCHSLVKSITEIFASKLINCSTQISSQKDQPKKVVPRLKQSNYGEVLTTNAVLQKLKEAEEKKTAGNKRKLNASHSKIFRKKLKIIKPNKTRNIAAEETNRSKAVDREDTSTLNQSESEDDLPLSNLLNTIPEVKYESPELHKIRPGKYVLVDFTGGRKSCVRYKYVCLVQSVDEEDGEIKVVGLRCLGSQRNEFKIQENDVSYISFEMIISMLPEPRAKTNKNNVSYLFNGFVDVFEKN